MKIMFLIVFLILSVSCTLSGVSFEEQNLLNKIIASKKSNNIKSLTDEDYENITRHISSGKERWIKLYPVLNQAPFLGVTYFQEGLNISMARALAENPAAVLNFVDESNVYSICGIPFIEPALNEINFYYVKTNAAIENLPSDAPWKSRCLSTLKRAAAREYIAEF